MRLGSLAFAREAIADIGRAVLWLSQPGAGRGSAARLDALLRAMHDIARAPYRWPPHATLPGMRRRSVRGGYIIVYRVLERASDELGEETEVEIVRVLAPGQQT
ncbi:type II toxin-antitoxin system RelE/ParE family toxin [Salinarimonas sp.]|uniref:type II toxin-antitoxin system RelE/ParE family toxin n=1 Tax=Salinarimonas sp. TaxID=2766526 RepID=UPI0032D93A2E